MYRDELTDELAEYLMINRSGFSSDKTEFPLEWDKTHENSQITLIIEDIEMIFDYLEEMHGYDFSQQPLNDN